MFNYNCDWLNSGISWFLARIMDAYESCWFRWVLWYIVNTFLFYNNFVFIFGEHTKSLWKFDIFWNNIFAGSRRVVKITAQFTAYQMLVYQIIFEQKSNFIFLADFGNHPFWKGFLSPIELNKEFSEGIT